MSMIIDLDQYTPKQAKQILKDIDKGIITEHVKINNLSEYLISELNNKYVIVFCSQEFTNIMAEANYFWCVHNMKIVNYEHGSFLLLKNDKYLKEVFSVPFKSCPKREDGIKVKFENVYTIFMNDGITWLSKQKRDGTISNNEECANLISKLIERFKGE